MRASQYLLATKKETPADAEIISHQLMLRAGMIRKLAAGLYTWLPLGLRVLLLCLARVGLAGAWATRGAPGAAATSPSGTFRRP